MALNAATMKAAMKAGIEIAGGTFPNAGAEAILLAICTAIVNHITANAVVVVASVSGVTAGGDSSGAGSGTVT